MRQDDFAHEDQPGANPFQYRAGSQRGVIPELTLILSRVATGNGRFGPSSNGPDFEVSTEGSPVPHTAAPDLDCRACDGSLTPDCGRILGTEHTLPCIRLRIENPAHPEQPHFAKSARRPSLFEREAEKAAGTTG